MNFKSFQAARKAALLQPSTCDVPLHRQLATIQDADQARLIRSLNLCRETHRYQTFNSGWPLDSAPSGREMAASGWFYLGNLDRTQCFSCGGVLRNWRRLDNPNTEHISHFPHCSMAQGRESRNIPDTKRQVLSPTSNVMSQLTGQQKADLRNMFPCEFPVTPSMRSVRERVNTFNNWHFTRTSPEIIAEAGFFSLGVRDRAKCFYCNGGLQSWRQDDNPWEEHAKWYPTCEFLLQQRGPKYVHNIVARFPNINRPILHAPGQDVPPPTLMKTSSEHLLSTTEKRQETASASNQLGNNRDLLAIAMKSEVVESVIGLGYDEDLVRDVMRVSIEQQGHGYTSAMALLEAAEEAQKLREEKEKEKSSMPCFHQNNNRHAASSHEERMEVDNNLNLYDGTPAASNAEVAETVSTSSKCVPSSSNDHRGQQSATTSRQTEQPTRSTINSTPSEVSSEEAKKLEQTLQQLQDEKLCKVCLDSEAVMVFIPCGHICCCMECTRALRTCPICRQKIEQAVRTYSS